MQAQQDAIGSLFGSGQRVDMYGSSAGAPQAPSPPPYDSQSNIDAESLPSYKKEVPYDAELSRKLFWYGFGMFQYRARLSSLSNVFVLQFSSRCGS